jgi:glycosyltransferase involved in cell wall biosynthesis
MIIGLKMKSNDKKITFISPGLYPFVKGGAEMQSQLLIESLIARGIDLQQISLNFKTDSSKLGGHVYLLGFGDKYFLLLSAIIHYFFIKVNKIIFISQLTGFTFFLILFTRKKYIYLRLSNSEKYFDIDRLFYGKFRFFVHYILKKKIHSFVSINPLISEQIGNAGFFQNIYNLNNAVVTNNKVIHNNSFKLVYIARFVPQKNFEFIKVLCQNGLIDKVDLYGQKSEYFTKIHSELIQFPNIYFNETFIDKSTPFNHSRAVLIHPSFVEGTSNAILEALSFGIPVIANNIKANCIFNSDGINGVFLISVDNPLNWIEIILKLKSDLNFYNLISKNALNYVKNKHNINHIVENLENFLFNESKLY